jgi:hypothetical protein
LSRSLETATRFESVHVEMPCANGSRRGVRLEMRLRGRSLPKVERVWIVLRPVLPERGVARTPVRSRWLRVEIDAYELGFAARRRRDQLLKACCKATAATPASVLSSKFSPMKLVRRSVQAASVLPT